MSGSLYQLEDGRWAYDDPPGPRYATAEQLAAESAWRDGHGEVDEPPADDQADDDAEGDADGDAG